MSSNRTGNKRFGAIHWIALGNCEKWLSFSVGSMSRYKYKEKDWFSSSHGGEHCVFRTRVCSRARAIRAAHPLISHLRPLELPNFFRASSAQLCYASVTRLSPFPERVWLARLIALHVSQVTISVPRLLTPRQVSRAGVSSATV